MRQMDKSECSIIAFDRDSVKNSGQATRYFVHKTNGSKEWMTCEQIILRSNKTLAKSFQNLKKAREEYVDKQNAFHNMLKPIRSDKDVLVSFYADIIKDYAQKHEISHYDIVSKEKGDVVKIISKRRPNKGVNIPFSTDEEGDITFHLKDASDPYAPEFLLGRAWLSLQKLKEKDGIFTSPNISTHQATKYIGKCTIEHCMRQLVATYQPFKPQESNDESNRNEEIKKISKTKAVKESDLVSDVLSNVVSDGGFEVLSNIDSDSVDGYESPQD